MGVEKNIIILDYIVIFMLFIFLIIVENNTYEICTLFSLYLIIFTARNLFLQEEDIQGLFRLLLLIFEIIIITDINLATGNIYPSVLYFLVVDKIILGYKKDLLYSLVFINYITFLFSTFISYKDNMENLIRIFLISIPIYGTNVFIFMLVKTINNKNKKIENSLIELVDRTSEKEKLNKKVEELIRVNERSRIAGEIHDNVGHNLTSALAQMEAGRRIITKKFDLGIEKYTIAQDQIREGLSEMRIAVRLMEREEKTTKLEKILKEIIENSQKRFNVIIRYDIREFKSSKEINELIVRAFKEGITNGVKHGESTAFIFKLYKEDKSIKFLLEDNGKGAESIEEGFGLENLRRKVEEKKGSLKIETSENQGFSLEIEIPESGGFKGD